MSKSEEAFKAYVLERYCACRDYPDPNNQACICGAQQGHCPVHCGFCPDKPPHAPLEWSGWRACCEWHQAQLRRMAESFRAWARVDPQADSNTIAEMLLDAAEELKG